jgi:histidine triad (HIT) family protein
VESCIFCKIINKEIPSSLVYEDDLVFAFNDIAPQAPVHILVVPKVHSTSFTDLSDYSIVGHIYQVIGKLAKERKLDLSGFRVVVNHGRAAGQAVPHLHYHLLGGRDLNWPPG